MMTMVDGAMTIDAWADGTTIQVSMTAITAIKKVLIAEASLSFRCMISVLSYQGDENRLFV